MVVIYPITGIESQDGICSEECQQAGGTEAGSYRGMLLGGICSRASPESSAENFPEKGILLPAVEAGRL